MTNCKNGVCVKCQIMKKYDVEWMKQQIHDGLTKREELYDLMATEIWEENETLTSSHVKSLVNARLDVCYDKAVEKAQEEDAEAHEREQELEEAMKGQY